MEKIKNLVLLMVLLAHATLAWTQGKPITVEFRGDQAVNALHRIERLSGLRIQFNYKDVDFRVLYKAENADPEQVVRDIVKGHGLQVRVGSARDSKGTRKYLIITRGRPADSHAVNRILDENGEPLVGATLRTKNNATVTDANGSFDIIIKDDDETVVISYLGYESLEIPVNQLIGQPIKMKASRDQVLNEVVVNGIYTRKAESFTGSAVTVTAKELNRVGNSNLLQSLKNLDPTVYIADNFSMGSDPNSLPDISMRGTSSFPAETSTLKSNYQHQPNQPLFILDGFETTVEHVIDLDMNRVESVTILKDASAKALYGNKAANGVIVIETKRLAGTETRITYNGSLNLEIPDLSSYDLTNAHEKLQVEQLEGLYTAGSIYNSNWVSTDLELQELYNKRYKRVLEGLSTDWIAKPLHVGVGHKHNINVELGDARSLRAVLNLTYNKVDGVMKESNRQNISGDVSVSYRKSNLLFKNILSVTSNSSTDSPWGTFSDYVKMNPYWEAEDAQGNILRWAEKSRQDVETSQGYSVPNPMYDATIGTSFKSTYSEFVNNFYTEWTITPDWKAVVRLGAQHKRNDSDEYYPANHSRFADFTSPELKPRRGLYILENGKQTQLSGDLNINYNHSFGNHNLFGNAGWFVSETKYQAYQHRAEGFANTTVADATFARQYAENSVPTGYATTNREMSFLAALSYDYGSRYLMDFTLRESASSLYGANKRWANSWSFGLGWNVHNEAFLKDSKWLKQFKIRGSLGLTGNQNFNTNAAIATYRYYAGVLYEGQSGAYLVNMPNSDLMWEQKKDFNAGFDLSLYGLSFSFDWYSADTKNMLTSITLPTSTGFSSVMDNLGLVRNSGLELKASYAPPIIPSKDGYITFYGSFVYTKNKIINLSESMREYNQRMMTLAENVNQSTPVLMYQDGLSMNTIWAVPSAGIDPQTGKETFIKKDGTYTYDYDANDMIAAGDATPKYRGTAGLSAEYKGWGLSATLTYLAGGQMYNYTLVDRVENVDINYNVDRRVLNGRWKETGQISQYKGFQANESTRATTRFVQDRNELSLSQISVYYEFPKNIYSKLYMQRLRLAAYLNDIATFSSIKVERGTNYPFARTLSFSLSATF